MSNMSIRLYQYYGGKIRFVELIAALIPEHRAMYELFGGSGALTMNYAGSGKQVLNEIDKDIFNLWEVVRDKNLCTIFSKRLEYVQYSQETFESAKKRQGNYTDRVERAVDTFILLTQSYNSTRQAFSEKQDNYYIEKNQYYVRKVHDRLQRIEIFNRNAIDILDEVKASSEAFLFLDPPYLHEYRGKGADKAYGKGEMTSKEHVKMLRIVKDAECKIMICGYRSKMGELELYDSILKESKTKIWHCYLLADIQKPNKGGERAKEYVWVNYELPVYAKNLVNVNDKMQ